MFKLVLFNFLNSKLNYSKLSDFCKFKKIHPLKVYNEHKVKNTQLYKIKKVLDTIKKLLFDSDFVYMFII